MNTYLGTSLHLNASHIPEDTQAVMIYLEGYLFDAPQGPEIFARAAEIARKTGAQLALSLSDPWCVERHHAQFRLYPRPCLSILFSNEQEIKTLTNTDRQGSIEMMAEHLDELIITLGADGAMVWCEEEQTCACHAGRHGYRYHGSRRFICCRLSFRAGYRRIRFAGSRAGKPLCRRGYLSLWRTSGKGYSALYRTGGLGGRALPLMVIQIGLDIAFIFGRFDSG